MMSWFTGVLLWLVSGVYHVAAFIFKIFLILAQGQIIDSNKYKYMIENFYILELCYYS